MLENLITKLAMISIFQLSLAWLKPLKTLIEVVSAFVHQLKLFKGLQADASTIKKSKRRSLCFIITAGRDLLQMSYESIWFQNKQQNGQTNNKQQNYLNSICRNQLHRIFKNYCWVVKGRNTIVFHSIGSFTSSNTILEVSLQEITLIRYFGAFSRSPQYLQSFNLTNIFTMDLSRLLDADEPSYQQSEESHQILVSKHLIPPPLSLLPKNESRKPRSLTPMLPLPNFIGIIPNFQPLNPAMESREQDKGLYYNWIGQAFDNIVYKKYEDSSYTKIDNAQENWNIWACDISKMTNKKSAENTNEQQIHPFYEPISKKDKTLVFQSRFECGNLSLVSKINDNQYNLLLQNDINTNGYSQWFFFKVSNTFKNHKVKFNILNQYKQNSLYRMGMKIIIYSQKQSQQRNLSWHRGGDNIQYYENGYSRSTLEYKPYYTLSWEYAFPYDEDEVYFAYSYPYTYSNLQSYISKIQSDSYLRTICQRSSICKTLAGNNVQLLTITQQHPYEKINKGYIIITARIHPGQSVSSYVCNGILEFLLSTNEKARKLRQYFIFKIIPMLNPDGVIHGNYRSNISGYDLNKRWENPSKNFHPQIFYLKKLISNLQEENQIHLFCDLHGHSMKKNAFIYGFHDQFNPRKGKEFPFLISKLFKGFSFKDCSFIDNNQEQISSRTVLAKQLKHCDIYALESSFCGPEYQNIHFTVRHFQELGQKFCEAILLHFKKKIKDLQIQAAMRQEEYFPNTNDSSFDTLPDHNILNSFSQIDQTVFQARVNSENSQGSQPEKQIDNVLEEKTIKKYLLIKYSRPHSSMKRNFLLRKHYSKDNINQRREAPKSTSPIKKRPLYETPVFEKPKTLAKIEKKPLQKIQPKMFEPIDIVPLGQDKKRRYRSHPKIGLNQYNYSSQKLAKNQEATLRKSTFKLVLNKNFEFKKQKTPSQNHNRSRSEKTEKESASVFKNSWLKGFINDETASSPIKTSRKLVSNEFIIKKNKVPYSDDRNGANLFKNVLSSLRREKK